MGVSGFDVNFKHSAACRVLISILVKPLIKTKINANDSVFGAQAVEAAA